MKELSREQLEKMVDGLTNVLLVFADAQNAEAMLRAAYGFDDDMLKAIGFDVEM